MDIVSLGAASMNGRHVNTYGTMLAIWDPPAFRMVLGGATAPNSRTGSIVALLRALFSELKEEFHRGSVFVQYDDFAQNNLLSIAFGRRQNAASTVTLIPDAYFLDSVGYRALRQKAHSGVLSPWHTRKDVVFWRGSATNSGKTVQDTQIERIEQIPRVALCLQLRDVPNTDAGIFSPWISFPSESTIAWLQAERIFRPAVSPEEQAQYRYLVDIDGVANAWGFFEKLLMGSCVLKVRSFYEQWFYNDVLPWTHYIPVAADLSDLAERIDWCRRNVDKAAAIAAAGQKFALSFSYDDALQLIRDALRLCFTPF